MSCSQISTRMGGHIGQQRDVRASEPIPAGRGRRRFQASRGQRDRVAQRGQCRGRSVPSLVNEATFARQFFTWADAYGVPSFYFSAFDEAWKANYEGPQGAHWGIWDEAGAIKPGMDAFFNGATEAVDCNALLPGPVGLSSVYVPPYGSSDALEVQVTGVRPRDYNIATYIFVDSALADQSRAFAQRTVAINRDGTAQITIVTNGTDQLATQIAAFLIPAGVAPPAGGVGGDCRTCLAPSPRCRSRGLRVRSAADSSTGRASNRRRRRDRPCPREGGQRT